MDYNKREPDIETEHLRIWNANDKKEIEEEGGFKIKVKDDEGNEVEMQLCGFNVAYSNKEKTDVIFAWKFKHDRKIILYYLAKKDDETAKKAIEFIKVMADAIGYQYQDAEENFKTILNDKGLLKMLDEKHKDGK